MELYYKDENGEFKVFTELKPGIYRVADIGDYKNVYKGTEMNFLKVSDLPDAIDLAKFYSIKRDVSLELSKYFGNIRDMKITSPPRVSNVFKIFEQVIKRHSRKRNNE